MRDDVLRATFGAMLRCEDRGDYSTMRAHIRSHAKEIIDSGDEAMVRDLSRLLVRVISAIDVEAFQGEGSLLKHDHPDHVSWSEGRWLPFKMAGSDHTGSPQA